MGEVCYLQVLWNHMAAPKGFSNLHSTEWSPHWFIALPCVASLNLNLRAERFQFRRAKATQFLIKSIKSIYLRYSNIFIMTSVIITILVTIIIITIAILIMVWSRCGRKGSKDASCKKRASTPIRNCNNPQQQYHNFLHIYEHSSVSMMGI